MNESRERLVRLLGDAGLATLRRRLRARFERGETRDEFTLPHLNEIERRALAGLLGRSVQTTTSMRLRLSELDAALSRAGLAIDLRSALETLDGPLVNLKAQRAERKHVWDEVIARVREPRLSALVSNISGMALLKRLCATDAQRAQALLTQTQRVLERLPARGVSRAQLAAEALGDAHALDSGRPVATLILQACASKGQLELAERIRDRWARVGVMVNELARPVLMLNLTALDESPGAKIARTFAASAEPGHLSLRALLRQPPQWNVCGRDVFVCENPEIVMIAAEKLGSSCAPLVCTDGMPAAAQRTLLTQLKSRGARLRYHGDFDWEGIAIGNVVMLRFAAAPWRFDAREYEAACPTEGTSLGMSSPLEAVWDSALAAAMAAKGILVHEEAVATTLLEDLRIETQ